MSDEQETPNSETPTEEVQKSLLTEETTQAEEAKPEESSQEEQKSEETPAEVVPLTVEDITIPEDVEVNSALVEEFLTVVNNSEMSVKDRAQALVDLQVKAMREVSETANREYADMQTKWRDEVKAAPEFAGEKLQPALGRIGRLLSEYGSDELGGVFDLTGAGNNLHVIRFLHNIAEKLVEGEPAFGQPKAQESSAAQRLFPSMKG